MFVSHGVSEWSLLPIFYCTQTYSFLSSYKLDFFFKTNVFNQLAQSNIVVVTNTIHMII